jgi:hypothetical protein
VHLPLTVQQPKRPVPIRFDLDPGAVGEAHVLGAVGRDLFDGAVGEGDLEAAVGVANLLLAAETNII